MRLQTIYDFIGIFLVSLLIIRCEVRYDVSQAPACATICFTLNKYYLTVVTVCAVYSTLHNIPMFALLLFRFVEQSSFMICWCLDKLFKGTSFVSDYRTSYSCRYLSRYLLVTFSLAIWDLIWCLRYNFEANILIATECKTWG